MGFMGFKDIAVFNRALLAKQGWRMLQQPDSLVSRVYKAKYYPRGDFMEAGAGNRPLYAWRSILSARSVLKMGMRWHIGNGNFVRIINKGFFASVFFFQHSSLDLQYC